MSVFSVVSVAWSVSVGCSVCVLCLLYCVSAYCVLLCVSTVCVLYVWRVSVIGLRVCACVLLTVSVSYVYVSVSLYVCGVCVYCVLCVLYLLRVCVFLCCVLVLLVTLLVWRLSWWCDGRLFFGFGGFVFLGGVACVEFFYFFIRGFLWVVVFC